MTSMGEAQAEKRRECNETSVSTKARTKASTKSSNSGKGRATEKRTEEKNSTSGGGSGSGDGGGGGSDSDVGGGCCVVCKSNVSVFKSMSNNFLNAYKAICPSFDMTCGKVCNKWYVWCT